jgi:stage V sporulation protein R
MARPLWTGADWQFSDLQRVYDACERIALKDMKLSCYPNQLEIISSEQMLDAYASIGMPIFYQHWSFGKHFVQQQKSYQSGHSGLAYELVINSSPCINYLMEDNTMTTQALVIAHAAFGHNHFFKNNYLFRQWTDAAAIVDYLIFARDYVTTAEVKHGQKNVEKWLDSCHALMAHGVNRYKRPGKLSITKERERQEDRARYLESQITELYRILPAQATRDETTDNLVKDPEENLLYFFEKYSPDIEDWQREILRIVRKIAQYFYPQAQTKVMNEGFASLTHYSIMNRLHQKGLTTDGAHLEFLSLHSNVLFQPGYDDSRYNGLNPYALGFAILRDIQRMVAAPTDEDLRWFPVIKDATAQELILDAVDNFRDESFIRQWLGPKVMREWRLFSVHDEKGHSEKYNITLIHNESGYQELRENLAERYLRSAEVPQLEITKVDRKTRTLHIRYTAYRGRQLANSSQMMPHIVNLWGGYPVILEKDNGDVIARHGC